jgi:hypothetical protein
MLLPLRTVSVTTAASRLAGQPITAHQRKSVHPVVQPVSRMNQRFTGRVTVRTGGAIRMPQAAPPLDLAERRRYDAQEPAPPSRGGDTTAYLASRRSAGGICSVCHALRQCVVQKR